MSKTVFLFNTHLVNIINDAERFLAELELVIEKFCDRQDVILLWRPHPLCIQTFESMNSKYLDRYMCAIAEFKKMSNGIYDDSADLYRAIAVSDAYIGSEVSSVATLYGMTGKPMWFIKQDRLPYYNTAITRAGIVKGNNFYFSTYNFNGFFRLNLVDGCVSYLGVFQPEVYSMGSIHSYVYAYGDLCYFVPEYGEYIISVNLVNHEMNKIIIPWFRTRPCVPKFKKGIADGKYMWLIPLKASVVVRLNMEEGTIKEYSDWPDMLSYDESRTQFSDGILIDGKLCLCPYGKNPWVCMDIISGKMTISTSTVSLSSDGYSAAEYDGRKVWLFPYNKKAVLKIDVKERKLERIYDFPEELKLGDKASFSACVKAGNAIWGFPNMANMIIKIDEETNQITGIQNYQDMFFCDKRNRFYGDFHKVIVSEGKIFAMSIYGKGILEINPETGESCVHSLEIPEHMYRESVNAVRKKGLGAYQEKMLKRVESNCVIPLEWFIDEVENHQLDISEEQMEDFQAIVVSAGISGTRSWKAVSDTIIVEDVRWEK